MRFFISDTHFGHRNVIDYSGRPFKTCEEMDNIMIARWNATVNEDDDVFMLGDFGFGSFDYLCDIFHSLAGNKILIRGNHDGSYSKMRRMGWSAVLEEATITIGGHDVFLNHYPWESTDTYALHGHIHEKGITEFVDYQMCMCVELWGYKPVSEKVIEKKIIKAEKWNAVKQKSTLQEET
jgi:calcineurin-like phosphoesterase family protein